MEQLVVDDGDLNPTAVASHLDGDIDMEDDAEISSEGSISSPPTPTMRLASGETGCG